MGTKLTTERNGLYLSNPFIEIGGASRDRTGDLMHAMHALSQLSYSPLQGAVLYMPMRRWVKP